VFFQRFILAIHLHVNGFSVAIADDSGIAAEFTMADRIPTKLAPSFQVRAISDEQLRLFAAAELRDIDGIRPALPPEWLVLAAKIEAAIAR
jgi:hypothetical protein